jgi:hypothetical protein
VSDWRVWVGPARAALRNDVWRTARQASRRRREERVKTRANIEWSTQRAQEIPELRFQVPVREILTSDLGSWLTQQNRLKPNSYNEISRQLKNIFNLAVNDQVIVRSPYDPFYPYLKDSGHLQGTISKSDEQFERQERRNSPRSRRA